MDSKDDCAIVVFGQRNQAFNDIERVERIKTCLKLECCKKCVREAPTAGRLVEEEYGWACHEFAGN